MRIEEKKEIRKREKKKRENGEKKEKKGAGLWAKKEGQRKQNKKTKTTQ